MIIYKYMKEKADFKEKMTMKGLLVDETMSNLTSASNEASLSSLASPTNPAQPAKRKRNLPGNPDPQAEVVALSPRTLMATNRFVCEICNKGFQRDQNLQLHRRGHNLPWKLKQRTNKEVIKKVYVCPEASCVHHEPSRALGDLTGIKKHYFRKHGEKKWKCDKCSKRYAVQSDWKAHFKICGTREYRCDCGTLFSRRDSFITHRAFCDALAEESVRAIITTNPLLSSQLSTNTSSTTHHLNLQQSFNIRQQIPPWLSIDPSTIEAGPNSQIRYPQSIINQENPNPSPTLSSSFQSHDSPHMSATGLLQKAAQMGVTMSQHCPESTFFRPHQAHMTATSTAGSVLLGLSSRDDQEIRTNDLIMQHGLASYGNKSILISSSSRCMELPIGSGAPEPMLHQNTLSRFQESGFGNTFDGMLNSKGHHGTFQEGFTESRGSHLSRSHEGEGMTRDFLGLRAFPHRDFFNMDGLDQIGSSSPAPHNHNQPPWQS